MYYDDHAPPHFHATYDGHQCLVSIAPISVIGGDLPKRAKSMVLEWAALHQNELRANWHLCHIGKAPKRISPLE